jgi:hypothetical protein
MATQVSPNKKYRTATDETYLTRKKFWVSIPNHLLLSLVFGAGGAVILSLISHIQLPGRWYYLILFPSTAIFVNAAVLPLGIPGRRWSFAFLCEMMLILSCFASGILSTWIPLPHSTVAENYLTSVNVITFLAMATGLSLGLFYGVIVGGQLALKMGAIFGLLGGYFVGLFSTALISHETETLNQFEYASVLHLAWQGAAGLLILHFFATLGALLGARSEAR